MKNTCGLNFLLFFFVITSCALSPQVIVINPDIEVDQSLTESKSTKLRLVVIDTRSSNVIGQRGGVYKETSDISTENNMTSSLERSLATAWNKLGYTVVDKGKDADATLTVMIISIKYVYHTEKALNNIEIHIETGVDCNKNYKEYSSTYRTTRKKDVLTVPTADLNAKLVNEEMALVLQQMLKDKDLVSFLDNEKIKGSDQSNNLSRFNITITDDQLHD